MIFEIRKLPLFGFLGMGGPNTPPQPQGFKKAILGLSMHKNMY